MHLIPAEQVWSPEFQVSQTYTGKPCLVVVMVVLGVGGTGQERWVWGVEKLKDNQKYDSYIN